MAIVLVMMGIFLRVSPAAPQKTNPPEPTRPEILEHWRLATISLGQVVHEGDADRFVTVGSALIVALDQQHGAILTAKHVVFDPARGYIPSVTYMRLPKNEPSTRPDMGILVPLIVDGKNLWQSLPDGSDIAVVPLPDLSAYKNVHAVAMSDFGQSEDIFQGASILVLGYPELLGPDYQTTPMARGGIIAWTDPDGKLEKPFVVDANLFNGNSGGPVFRIKSGFDRYGNMTIGGGYSFIGIVSKDAYEEAPVHVGEQFIGQIDQATGRRIPYAAQVKNIGGVGIVEPVYRVRLLLEKVWPPLALAPKK